MRREHRVNVFWKQVRRKPFERIRLNAIASNLYVPADGEITFERFSIGETIFFKYRRSPVQWFSFRKGTWKRSARLYFAKKTSTSWIFRELHRVHLIPLCDKPYTCKPDFSRLCTKNKLESILGDDHRALLMIVRRLKVNETDVLKKKKNANNQIW